MGLKAAHSPEAPAAWPRLLMALALPSGSPGCVGSSRGYPFCQTTGLNCSFCGLPDGHVASGASFSATPATTPEPLIRLAQPLLPPSVGSALMTPFCHRNGTQVVPEDERPSATTPDPNGEDFCGFKALGRAGRRKTKCLETAEVLAIRVRSGGLGLTHSLAKAVHAKGLAVRTLESVLAEIYDLISWRLGHGNRGEQAAPHNAFQNCLFVCHVCSLHQAIRKTPARGYTLSRA